MVTVVSRGPELLPQNHLALEFLNTRRGMGTGMEREYIADGESLVEWMEAAAIVSRRSCAELQRRFPREVLHRIAFDARGLRERMREAIDRWTSEGTPPSRALVEYVNAILASSEDTLELTVTAGRMQVARSRRFSRPKSLLAPVAEAFASLFVHGDPTLVRMCEAEDCALWFYDRTRSHRRRWCSMATCGTRAKVRAFRRRPQSR